MTIPPNVAQLVDKKAEILLFLSPSIVDCQELWYLRNMNPRRLAKLSVYEDDAICVQLCSSRFRLSSNLKFTLIAVLRRSGDGVSKRTLLETRLQKSVFEKKFSRKFSILI